ncbi:hypothetical protein [Erwinia rhapontici]|uniref:hypothetical protein n=1 Tax=Erwinia rhapontici TaxID=55212 RepID=UPI003BA0CB2C
MEKIYLDQNIWLDIQLGRNNNSLEVVLKEINRDKVEIIYSPANIEEICNSYRSPRVNNKISLTEKDNLLSLLSQVACDREIIPYSNNFKVIHSFCGNEGPFIISEPPEDCFNRVNDKYQSNIFAELAQESSIRKSFDIDEGFKRKIGRENFAKIIETDSSANELFFEIFTTKLIHKAAFDYLIKCNVNLHPWSERVDSLLNSAIFELRSKHSQDFFGMAREILEKKEKVNITSRGFGICEAAVDAVMLTMIEFGYGSKEVSMSSLHDNSHSIYAAYCDLFITRDGNLLKKLIPAYEFWGINTKIINANNEDWHIYLR